MKGIAKHITSIMGAALTAASMALISTSCNALYDDLPECQPSAVDLRFVYEYNMERANAFHNQVDCLTLYVYDEQGRFVTRATETSAERLGDESYRMTLRLPEGKYHAVAYGGMECERSSFRHPSAPGADTRLADLQVEMHPDCLTDDARRQLHNHFHGAVDFEVATHATTSAKVEMMRNTNTIQVALQHLNGSPIDHADFDFAITDDNTLFDADNNLIPAGEVTYLPYLAENRSTGTVGRADDAAAEQEWHAAIAEFTTSRIVGGKSVSPTLHVTRHSDGETVLKLPLVNYMLLFKQNHDDTAPMGNQEYLDRENRWNFVFFLDERDDNAWVKSRIVINDWEVRINDTHF